jgi:hypothetical protein
MADSDPTKDPEFQKVIRHFVTTPHKPHGPIGKRKPKNDADASPKKRARPPTKIK